MKVRAKPTRRTSQIAILLVIAALSIFSAASVNGRAALTPPCDHPGWFPGEFGLKDHHMFLHAGNYYLISTYLPYGSPLPPAEDRFAYARSLDLCTWETLAPVLPTRLTGAWDEKAIWAPFVYQENGVSYLYYTGVTNSYTQSILLATSSDPSLPGSWETQEMVFQPDHPSMLWTAGAWADCRDPSLLKANDVYYLYYTARDQAGGIIGLATAPTPAGPWSDQGSMITPIENGMPESPTVAHYGDHYYLFYNLSYGSGEYRIGESPTGPWQDPLPFRPGWAHEVWQDADGEWLTSYLTSYTVSIAPLTWDAFTAPAHPFVGPVQTHLALPMVSNP